MAVADYLPANPKNPVAREIARAARRYLKRFNGFSYDFDEGGEKKLLQSLQPLDLKVVFDVGANVGEWSEKASGFFPMAVFHTFEISEANFGVLERKLTGNTFVHNRLGLSNQEGSIAYKDYGDGSGLNTIVPRSCIHDKTQAAILQSVDVTTGDEYCRRKKVGHIDFLKIDVEGAEKLVLEGFGDLLRRKAVRFVQFEYGLANGDTHFLMRDFFDLFGVWGYQLSKVRKRGFSFDEFSYEWNNFDSGPNFLAVLKTDREALGLLHSP